MKLNRTTIVILSVAILCILGWVVIIHNIQERLYSRNLIAAIEENDHEKLEELLGKNGNIDAVPFSSFHAFFLEIFNDPPLFYAIRNGDVESVQLLLEHGANANIVLDDYYPLMVAAQSLKIERFEIANLLIDYSADINKEDKWGNTPVQYFVIGYNRNDDYESGYALFIRFVSINAIPSNNQEFYYGNYLLYAVSTNNTEIVDYLIENYDYNMNSMGRDGTTALIRATQYNAILVVEYLIENGVDTTYTDNFGKTAYDYAVEKGFIEIINLLE